MMLTQDKITERHRERYAYVYVRQSTPKQVQRSRTCWLRILFRDFPHAA
jgi:hypothetical protein